MRITGDLARYTAGLERLRTRIDGQFRAQERLATGRRFTRPSEDVAGMNQAMSLRSALRVAEQRVRAAEDGATWVNLADQALQSVLGGLQRARELAVQGASSVGAEERAAIATEIAAIRDDLVSVANSRHQGRGLFAGYALDDAVTKVGGAWTYTGDGGVTTRRIGDGETVVVGLPGDQVFGIGGGTDPFSVLDGLEAALGASDTPAIQASLDGLDAAHDAVTAALTAYGAAGARLEVAGARLADRSLTLRSQLTEVEDVDVAEAIMELRLQEASYQAALAAFATSERASLVDFLR